MIHLLIIRVALLLGTAAMLVTSLVTSEARADDHRRPSSALIVSSERQAGRPVHWSWARRVGPDECIVTDAVGPTTFPHALRYGFADEAVFVRLRKDEMPVEYSLEAWRSVRRDGTPRGSSQPVPATLMPHRRDGEIVAWDLHFQPPYLSGHVFLMATAYWPDETGCLSPPDLGSQSASWTFHIRSLGTDPLT